MSVHELSDDERWIGGELHHRIAPGHWVPYRGSALDDRMRQLNDDNPAPCFTGDNDDK